MVNAIGYVRRSLEDKDKKNLSIQNQDELILQYAKDKGYDFIDDPESVVDKDDYESHSFNEGYISSAKCNRTVLRRMVKFVKDNKIDWIIVKDTSRLGRIMLQVEPLCQRLKIYGVNVWSINENYSVIEDDTKRLLTITMDQRHFDNSSQAANAMMINKEKKRQLFSRPPFGYKVKKIIGDDGKAVSLGWEIVEDEAEIIREMFNYFNEDGSYIIFAKKLGVFKGVIKKRLKNKVYCGYFTYTKFVYKPINIKIDKNGDEIEVKELHEKTEHQYKVSRDVLKPIIKLETWEKAQRRFDVMREKYRKKIK